MKNKYISDYYKSIRNDAIGILLVFFILLISLKLIHNDYGQYLSYGEWFGFIGNILGASLGFLGVYIGFRLIQINEEKKTLSRDNIKKWGVFMEAGSNIAVLQVALIKKKEGNSYFNGVLQIDSFNIYDEFIHKYLSNECISFLVTIKSTYSNNVIDLRNLPDETIELLIKNFEKIQQEITATVN